MPKSKHSISDLQSQIQILDENWKRALADYQNLLRRVDTDKQQFVKLSNANLIARLLPSLDVIELAATHSGDIGVQMAAKQFNEALTSEGLQVIVPTVGENFDPNLHECSDTLTPDVAQNENTIAETLLKGYKINDYVLRPAKVKVYKKS
jgi:molecular chaperone GrpE